MFTLNKLSVLEKCNQMFMCSICCDQKLNGQSKRFSTSTASLFLEHLRCYHSSIGDFECIYCCCRVSSVNIVHHIQNHFLSNNDITKCVLCQELLGQSLRNIVEHFQNVHCGATSICPYCQGDFKCLNDLQTHLFSSQIIMYHCSASQCMVKTHSKIAILNHLSNKHNGSRCVRVQRQFTCSEQIIRNTNCGCSMPANQMAHDSTLKTIATTEEAQYVDLPFSSRVLTKLSIGFDDRLQEDLCAKMEQYAKFKVRLDVVDGQKQFVCGTCQYRSVHSLADVRKHILGCHCSVSTSYTRLCLRASRLDTNNFTLFSDRKLISFANEKLKRAENGATLDGGCDYSGLQLLDDSEQESGSNSESLGPPLMNKRQAISSAQEISAKKAKMKPRQSQGTKMRSDSPVPEVGAPLERNEAFDRVIHLNYSWPVLERLVRGQCLDRYLPILKQKMDVYSQHRILLTRRNGKRYFLCSHCPNCSPHGMNDIRKHILGVHARLPERFKSAAMYCSRMNRDNYGLLSDDELLKKNQDMVRWRATPSQDPEDLGMEPLAPLNHSLLSSSSPEDCCQESTLDNFSRNIFLSEDTGGSPNSLTIGSDHMPSSHNHTPFHAMTSNIIGNGTCNNTAQSDDEGSSPKNEEVQAPSTHVSSKGRSRRSLVLKSKSHPQSQTQSSLI